MDIDIIDIILAYTLIPAFFLFSLFVLVVDIWRNRK